MAKVWRSLCGVSFASESGGEEITLERELHGAAVELRACLRGKEERVAVVRAGVEIGLDRADGGTAERAEPFFGCPCR